MDACVSGTTATRRFPAVSLDDAELFSDPAGTSSDSCITTGCECSCASSFSLQCQTETKPRKPALLRFVTQGSVFGVGRGAAAQILLSYFICCQFRQFHFEPKAQLEVVVGRCPSRTKKRKKTEARRRRGSLAKGTKNQHGCSTVPMPTARVASVHCPRVFM